MLEPYLLFKSFLKAAKMSSTYVSDIFHFRFNCTWLFWKKQNRLIFLKLFFTFFNIAVSADQIIPGKVKSSPVIHLSGKFQEHFKLEIEYVAHSQSLYSHFIPNTIFSNVVQNCWNGTKRRHKKGWDDFCQNQVEVLDIFRCICD